MATLPVPQATSRTRWPAVMPRGLDQARPESPDGLGREPVVVAGGPHRARRGLDLGRGHRGSPVWSRTGGRELVDPRERRSLGDEPHRCGQVPHVLAPYARGAAPTSPGPAIFTGGRDGQVWLRDGRFEQAVAHGVCRRGGPRREAELAQDVGHVAVHGVLADDQPPGDLAIRQPGREQRQHLPLAWSDRCERRAAIAPGGAEQAPRALGLGDRTEVTQRAPRAAAASEDAASLRPSA